MDLGEPTFSEPVCRSFLGNMSILSRQKFSSNVVEKGIRTAGEDTRRAMISEMLDPVELDKMLRDSFANYVVQTAMDFADPEMKAALVDQIRPILPGFRHTPHGRRIATKVQEYDGRVSNPTSGQVTPRETMSSGQLPYGQAPGYGRRSNAMGNYAQPANGMGGGGYSHNPHQNMPSNNQRPRNAHAYAPMPAQYHGFPAAGRSFHMNGMNHY